MVNQKLHVRFNTTGKLRANVYRVVDFFSLYAGTFLPRASGHDATGSLAGKMLRPFGHDLQGAQVAVGKDKIVPRSGFGK